MSKQSTTSLPRDGRLAATGSRTVAHFEHLALTGGWDDLYDAPETAANVSFRVRLVRTLELLPPEAALVLDVGCGPAPLAPPVLERGADYVGVRGPDGPLRAVDGDLNEFPDAVLALAVTALFAQGTTRIRNVWNLRIKETDRLAALETELRKLGASARTTDDSLTIEPGEPRGAAISP